MSEPLDLDQQILAQRAADAAIAHLDQLFVFSPAVSHERGVDIDLAHVIDDDRDPPVFAIVQNVIEQGRLAPLPESRTAP